MTYTREQIVGQIVQLRRMARGRKTMSNTRADMLQQLLDENERLKEKLNEHLSAEQAWHDEQRELRDSEESPDAKS